MHKPVLLLVAVGFLLAANINVASAAARAGTSSLAVAFASTFGAGVILMAVAAHSGQGLSQLGRHVPFLLFAGAVSYAIPNALVFLAADRVGPAFAAILHVLVPALTYLIALAWGADKPSTKRLVGVGLGGAGALIVVVARLGFSTAAETFIVLIVLAAPISIATGNVVRSRYWPDGLSPLVLASGLLIASGLQLGLVLATVQASVALTTTATAWLLAQVMVSALFYALYFRLQHAAGPVYVSQIGYVAAAFAVPFAMLAGSDRVTLAMLFGVALIVGGVLLVRPHSVARVAARSGDQLIPGASP